MSDHLSPNEKVSSQSIHGDEMVIPASQAFLIREWSDAHRPMSFEEAHEYGCHPMRARHSVLTLVLDTFAILIAAACFAGIVLSILLSIAGT